MNVLTYIFCHHFSVDAKEKDQGYGPHHEVFTVLKIKIDKYSSLQETRFVVSTDVVSSLVF